ncbi:sulfotransferase [Phenylobacterium sp. LjRoot225]|uniref:sulfotransferase family protein n=1 Tax=Phenylobacterium sp. LjRoot225 TaxID=3342285 RepID=UPI003ECFC496
MLDAAAIIAEAEAKVGIADSDVELRPNLEALVASINADARMPPWGEAITHRGLAARTIDRLEGLKWLRDHPEIAEETVVAPVFLTGLPRSGTTAFQYLFDRDARFRMIRTWEGITPSPPPGADPASVVRRKAEEEMRRREAHPKVEGFEALHLHDYDGPEECHAFLEQSYAAAGFNNLLNVPSYFDQLVDEIDFAAAYRIHRRQLQLLQWRTPQPRWALKYPNHVLAMDEILEVYPDARFVMTHRDPVQTLASISKMSLKLREVRTDEPVDPHEVGRQMLHFVQRHIDRILDFAAGPDAGKVVHVDYYRMLEEPVGVMTEVHHGLGVASPREVLEAVADWRRRNPKGARGSNPYALEQFGLNAEAVAEQFGDYMRRFDIPREQAGLARTAA